jgi:hypothetical protein
VRRDVVFGAAAGVLVIAAIVLAIRVLSDGGDGAAPDGVCRIGLGTVRVPISEEAFQRGDERLRQMAESAEEGDYDSVWESFYPFAHALTHDVDFRLRDDGQEELANDLCEAVLALELDIVAPDPDFRRLGQRAEEIRLLLERARAELGFAP